jgi:hypothetical protein
VGPQQNDQSRFLEDSNTGSRNNVA